MPTAFSHAFVAVALGKTFKFRPSTRRFWILSIFCAVIPDIDVLAFGFGLDYSHMLGHRGLTHSLFFAIVLSALVVVLGFREVKYFSARWWALIFYFFMVTASHGLLDALTNGGLGVAFFAPFSSTRYFLPWAPLEVSPIGLSFFSPRGLEVIKSEFLWIWIPGAALIALRWLVGKILRLM